MSSAESKKKSMMYSSDFFSLLKSDATKMKVDYIISDIFGTIREALNIDNPQIIESVDEHDLSKFIHRQSLHNAIDKLKFLKLYKSIRNQYLAANPATAQQIVAIHQSMEGTLQNIESTRSAVKEFASKFDTFLSDLKKSNESYQNSFVSGTMKSLAATVDSVYRYKLDRLRQQSTAIQSATKTISELYSEHINVLNSASMDRKERKQALLSIADKIAQIEKENPPKLCVNPIIDWKALQTTLYRDLFKSSDVILPQPNISVSQSTEKSIAVKFEIPNDETYKSLMDNLAKAMPFVLDATLLEFEFGVNTCEQSNVDPSTIVWQSVTAHLNTTNDNIFVITDLLPFTHYIVRMRFVGGGIVASDYSKPITVKTYSKQFQKYLDSRNKRGPHVPSTYHGYGWGSGGNSGSCTQQLPLGTGYSNEIVSIHVGRCGVNLGTTFWETISGEHRIDGNGLLPAQGKVSPSERLGVYYDESEAKDSGSAIRYRPRSIFCDLEPGSMDLLQNSAIGGMFHPDQFILGKNSGHDNWCRARYHDGAQIIDQFDDHCRKVAESCDVLQGFQLYHSLGGGTGSGLGTLIMQKLADKYPKKIMNSISVMPDLCRSTDPVSGDTNMQPYNTTLGFAQILANADVKCIIDNSSVASGIARRHQQMGHASVHQMNEVLASALSNISAPYRYYTNFNGNLRKFATNMTIRPSLSLFGLEHAPFPKIKGEILGKSIEDPFRYHPTEVVNEMMGNSLSGYKSEDGKYINECIYYRGPLEDGAEAASALGHIQAKYADDFVEWIPNNVQSVHITNSQLIVPRCATAVTSHTAIKGPLQRLSSIFAKFYRRKARLFLYKDYGLDEMEFQEADRSIRDMITTLQDTQDAVVDLDPDIESEEEDSDDYDEEEEEEEDDDDDF